MTDDVIVARAALLVRAGMTPEVAIQEARSLLTFGMQLAEQMTDKELEEAAK